MIQRPTIAVTIGIIHIADIALILMIFANLLDVAIVFLFIITFIWRMIPN